jgi:hypothetical protein
VEELKMRSKYSTREKCVFPAHDILTTHVTDWSNEDSGVYLIKRVTAKTVTVVVMVKQYGELPRIVKSS